MSAPQSMAANITAANIVVDMIYTRGPARCGVALDSRTLRRREVEATCPFCHDHGPGKYHLSLNTATDQYRCHLCGTRGNSVTLYAQLMGATNREAYQALKQEGKVYPMPRQEASPKDAERQPLPLEHRHEAYAAMLDHLTLLDQHRENLLERGLSEERIARNQYRSMPETDAGRRLLAALLRSCGHELDGLNRREMPLVVNSLFIIDDEKQRSNMTEEFYAAVKKEIATCQERADYLIKSGIQSPAVMERWVLKIRTLEEKKKHYEGVLRRELDGLDDEFATLKFLGQELQVRAQSIRTQKAA